MSQLYPDESAIRQEAREFRRGIEMAIKAGDQLPEWFRTFPRGCCGDTAEALAEHFLSKFECDVRVISAWTADNHQSHSWIRVNGVNVDITGDQAGASPVTVTTDVIWTNEYPEQSSNQPAYNEANMIIQHAVRRALAKG